jgi:hypothetical protein
MQASCKVRRFFSCISRVKVSNALTIQTSSFQDEACIYMLLTLIQGGELLDCFNPKISSPCTEIRNVKLNR